MVLLISWTIWKERNNRTFIIGGTSLLAQLVDSLSPLRLTANLSGARPHGRIQEAGVADLVALISLLPSRAVFRGCLVLGGV